MEMLDRKEERKNKQESETVFRRQMEYKKLHGKVTDGRMMDEMKQKDKYQ